MALTCLPPLPPRLQTGACGVSVLATNVAHAEYTGQTGADRLKDAPAGTGLLRVVETPVLRQLFTRIRDSTTGTADYVFYMNRLMR